MLLLGLSNTPYRVTGACTYFLIIPIFLFPFGNAWGAAPVITLADLPILSSWREHDGFFKISSLTRRPNWILRTNTRGPNCVSSFSRSILGVKWFSRMGKRKRCSQGDWITGLEFCETFQFPAIDKSFFTANWEDKQTRQNRMAWQNDFYWYCLTELWPSCQQPEKIASSSSGGRNIFYSAGQLPPTNLMGALLIFTISCSTNALLWE